MCVMYVCVLCVILYVSELALSKNKTAFLCIKGINHSEDMKEIL